MQKNYENIVREFVETMAPAFYEEAKRFYSPKKYKNFVEKVKTQVEAETYVGFAATWAENLSREIPMAFDILGQVEKGKAANANQEYLALPFMDRLRIYELLEDSYYALELMDSLKQTMASSLEGVFPENSPSQQIIIKNESAKLEKIAKQNKKEGTVLQSEKTEQSAQQIAN